MSEEPEACLSVPVNVTRSSAAAAQTYSQPRLWRQVVLVIVMVWLPYAHKAVLLHWADRAKREKIDTSTSFGNVDLPVPVRRSVPVPVC